MLDSVRDRFVAAYPDGDGTLERSALEQLFHLLKPEYWDRSRFDVFFLASEAEEAEGRVDIQKILNWLFRNDSGREMLLPSRCAAPSEEEGFQMLVCQIRGDAEQMAAVSMIQRNFRGYRDMREDYLGFALRKKDDSKAVKQHVLRLWDVGEERPAGILSVADKHALLSEARQKGETVDLHGDFGQSVLKRVANLGRGICETDSPLLLAHHQWLESSDTQHRYGAYLFEYYAIWAQSDTMASFFYWLDYGDGKEILKFTTANGKEMSRDTLESANVRYCNRVARRKFEVEIEGGKLFWINEGMKLCNSAKEKASDGEAIMMIYVMDPAGILYVGDKITGKFHHSSFLSGSTTIAAGSMCIEQGVLLEITPHSGHYRPSDENFQRCMALLKERGLELTNVKVAEQKLWKDKNLVALVEGAKKKPA